MNDKAQMRAILPLLKARVISRSSAGFKIAIGGSTTVAIDLPSMHLYDIRDGDLLTIYTEVLYAKPQQPPVQ